jgi:hypothetical protein
MGTVHAEIELIDGVDVMDARRFKIGEDAEPLLGAIPMEAMDVLVHPARQEMIVNPEHPDYAVVRL